MKTFWQDVKYGVRMLAKAPGFTLVAVVTLALGIGANTAIFSVVNGLVLRPLPVKGGERLVVLGITHEGNMDPHNVSLPDFEDVRESTDVFEDSAGFLMELVGLSAGERAERIAAAYVTAGYFQMLGVEALHGRVLRPEEGAKPGTDPVIVLGNRYWKKRFGADPEIVGQAVKVNGHAFTVVGVVPERFKGTFALVELDAYVPLGMATVTTESKALWTERDNHQVRTLMKLKPGATIAQANAQLEVVARQLEAQYPDTNKTLRIEAFPEMRARPEAGSARQNPVLAGVFLTLTGLVLLVACVNVANLLLLRGTLRAKEIAIRAAMGAGMGRLVRQMLTESVLLSVMGGGAGLVLGWWANSLLGTIRLPGDLPFDFTFPFDWRVFGYVAGVALVTGVVVGLLPALRASRTNLNDTLREGGRALAAGAGRHRLRNTLVVAQVSGTLVLLVAAGLFLRSMRNAESVDLGFQAKGVTNFTMDVAQQGYDEARGKALYEELQRRVKSLPGVAEASQAHSVPMGYYNKAEFVHVEGGEVKTGMQRPIVGYNNVSPEYMAVMRLPLVRGRWISEQDNEKATRVAVINEKMAAEMWPGQEPLGRKFRLKGPEGALIEVVGVTKTGKYQWMFQDPEPYMFFPLAQEYQSMRALQVRTSGRVEGLTRMVEQEVRALDPSLPVFDVQTMEEALGGGNGFFLLRMGAMFAGVLGALGLSLAVVGVYGVVSYAAGQRTHEIGIRMALGAQPGGILKMMLRQGMVLVAIGVGIGLVLWILLSVGLSKVISNMLFGISPRDVVTLVGVVMVLALVALVASWVPAWRATKVDPMVALRYE